MIIQCEQCETKYRFDESLVPLEGIWVRCSHCRHEFFQHHPSAQPPGEDELTIPDIHSDQYSPIPELLPNSEEPAVDTPAGEAEKEEELPSRKAAPRTPLTILYLLLALILLASLGIWFLPDVRLKAMKMLAPHVPAIESALRADQPKRKTVPEEIRIQSVRQRFVNNATAGSIRVIQGDVFNGSEVPLTRIRVKAELADASDAVIAAKGSYTGNLLTDEELTVVPDEGIQQKLSYIQGSTISNDRVAPNSLIPFMIVVAAEPPGVANVYLSIDGAERLLQ
jgi:predicted Zn finger-like uncharacterized protein